MWVLFSELFPNRVRGLAISFSGLVNSSVAFLVTFIFPVATRNHRQFRYVPDLRSCSPWSGSVFVMRILPETKGRSLEELETHARGLTDMKHLILTRNDRNHHGGMFV